MFSGQFCLFILPEPQRILRLTHSSCFSALTADNINCQLLRMCNGMHTVPLRIYAPVSLKSCCNLRNCLAFCGLIACLLHCGIVQLLKGGLYGLCLEIEISWAVLWFSLLNIPEKYHSYVLQENPNTAWKMNTKIIENAHTKHINNLPSPAETHRTHSLLGPTQHNGNSLIGPYMNWQAT